MVTFVTLLQSGYSALESPLFSFLALGEVTSLKNLTLSENPEMSEMMKKLCDSYFIWHAGTIIVVMGKGSLSNWAPKANQFYWLTFNTFSPTS